MKKAIYCSTLLTGFISVANAQDQGTNGEVPTSSPTSPTFAPDGKCPFSETPAFTAQQLDPSKTASTAAAPATKETLKKRDNPLALTEEDHPFGARIESDNGSSSHSTPVTSDAPAPLGVAATPRLKKTRGFRPLREQSANTATQGNKGTDLTSPNE